MKIIIKEFCDRCPFFEEIDWGEYVCNVFPDKGVRYGGTTYDELNFPIPEYCSGKFEFSSCKGCPAYVMFDNKFSFCRCCGEYFQNADLSIIHAKCDLYWEKEGIEEDPEFYKSVEIEI